MARSTFFLVSLLSACLLAGCNHGSSSESASGSSNAAGTATQIDPATSPIAKVAYEFVDAVFKGEPQRASACLTPQAMQHLVENKEVFSPQGMEKVTIRVGGVRTPSETHGF